MVMFVVVLDIGAEELDMVAPFKCFVVNGERKVVFEVGANGVKYGVFGLVWVWYEVVGMEVGDEFLEVGSSKLEEVFD